MPDPGLDLNQLRALRSRTIDTTTITDRIRAHLDAHDGYLAFSGGKDSLAVLHLARNVDPAVPVAFFDSGFEFPETYDYIADLAAAWNLNLHVFPARHSALQLLHDAGTWDHHVTTATRRANLHRTLIAEPAARAHQRFGAGELWGLRAEESRGRAAYFAHTCRPSCDCTPPCTTAERRIRHGGEHQRIDGTISYSPVWNWTSTQVWGYLTQHQVPINPVYARLRSLGAPETALRVTAVLDGNGLDRGRLTWLRRGWPALFDELALILPRIREFA